MITAIVDTNVPLVANGKHPNVTSKCRLATMDFLESLLHNGKLAVDIEGEIEAEYRKQLGVGQPGIGNRFLQKFFTEAVHRVVRVSVPVDKKGDYVNFKFDGEIRKFDLSDRKFVALAAVSGHAIYNATDTDWIEHKENLEARGIVIHFLCGCDSSSWFVKTNSS